MTYKLPIEALGAMTPDDFAVLVHNRIESLREYDAHQAIVRMHALVPSGGMPDEERYVTLAVPDAPAEVDAAICRTPRDDGTTEFFADYEIVGPSFETRKARLFQKVSQAEGEALAAVLPQGKVRAFQFREHDIRAADQKRYASEAAGAAAINVAPPDFEKFTHANRSEADTRFLEEQAARQDQRNEIVRWAAQLHSDIEDLTPDTVDAWEMKPFHD